jgi:hypothetical protein
MRRDGKGVEEGAEDDSQVAAVAAAGGRDSRDIKLTSRETLQVSHLSFFSNLFSLSGSRLSKILSNYREMDESVGTA